MGIKKKILKEGAGDMIEREQFVKVHCTGLLDNGTKFWSTRDPDQDSFEFQTGKQQVVKGFEEAVLTMRVGEIAEVTCPPEMAYGSRGFHAWGIPAHATLNFQIEILSVR